MKITSEKLELIRKAITEKGVATKCFECGSESLNLNDLEHQLVSRNRDKTNPTLDNLLTYRLVSSVICNNCGSIKLFDLVTLIGKDEAVKL